MRKSVFFFIFLFNVACMSSQVWCTPGATWYFNHGNRWTGPGYVKFTYTGDTVIGSKTCQGIALETYAYLSNHKGGITTSLENNVVYLVTFPSSQPAQFDTLYNFSAVPGDKWSLAPKKYQQCVNVHVVVLDTGRNVVQGQNLKWLYIQYKNSMYNSFDTIYERFGAKYWYPYEITNICNMGPDKGWGGSLRCFSDHEISNYRNNYAGACDFYETVVSARDVQQDPTLQLYPNPFSEHIELRGAEGNSTYLLEVTDFSGRTVLKTELDRTGANTSALKTGFYFVTLHRDGERVYRGKLVKRRSVMDFSGIRLLYA